jgi:hypothetical protein
MIGGFASSRIRHGTNSGIMTFIVNHKGAVYEKDLGPNTANIAGDEGVQPGLGLEGSEVSEINDRSNRAGECCPAPSTNRRG